MSKTKLPDFIIEANYLINELMFDPLLNSVYGFQYELYTDTYDRLLNFNGENSKIEYNNLVLKYIDVSRETLNTLIDINESKLDVIMMDEIIYHLQDLEFEIQNYAK